MKPKKLIMSGFCPYSSQESIDFDIFGGGGLFLITGETGAGKTTVFDGISFALYGEVSGENRGVDTLRSDFAKSETPTFVNFVFEHKGEIYEITRNPKYSRPSKRGDGLTTQNADANLSMPNGKIITGAKDVTEEVMNILSINHKQFKQISMIAQGEFLKLLLANSKDRGEIFRKVFGTEIYERIQQELKNRTNELKNQLEDINLAILQYNEGIICSDKNENYESLETLKCSVYGLKDIIGLLSNLIEEIKLEKNEKLEEESNLSDKIDNKSGEIAVASQMNDLIDKLEHSVNYIKELNIKKDSMDIIQNHLDLSKKALRQVKPAHIEYKSIQKQCHDLEINIQENTDIIEKNLPIKQIKEVELEQLKKEESQRENLLSDIKKIEESLTKYKELEDNNLRLGNLGINKNLENKNILEFAGKIEECKRRMAIIFAELGFLKDIDTQKIQLENEINRLMKEQNDIISLKNNFVNCLELNDKLKNMQHDFKVQEQKYNNVKQKYDHGEQLFYAQQAGVLAEMLEENTVCPVCGSLEHPRKAEKMAETLSQKQLNDAKVKLEILRDNYQKSSENCQIAEAELRVKKNQILEDAKKLDIIKDDKVITLQNGIDVHEKLIKENIIETENLFKKAKHECTKKEKLEKEQENLQHDKESYEISLDKKKMELSQIEIEISALATTIKTLVENLEFGNEKAAKTELSKNQKKLKDMKNQLISIQNQYQSICDTINKAAAVEKNNIEKLTITKEYLEKIQQIFRQRLSECGFPTESDYVRALVSEDKIEEMENNLNNYHIEVEKTNAAILQLEEQTKGKKKVDIAALNDEQKSMKELQLKIKESLRDTEHVIKTNKQILSNLQKKQEERERIEKVYSEIKMLSDTANGDLKGKQKLPFEQYVQGVYFDMILSEANKRLGKMTDRRYSLIRREEASNNQSKSGLEIDVIDNWTGKNRSVKSLSGGESFKASLALALGLSDVVQTFSGGIELDTMFIDEGFGSLDSESLEKAMEILTELTESNRLVGIISHVDELKEKIDNKIIVMKDRQGSKIQMTSGRS